MGNKTVVVGMSGGVDSSVAALLLKEQGYDVIGVTMQIWPEEAPEHEGGCCGVSAAADARAVAEKIGIPFYVIDFTDVFREKVIDYFTCSYLNGKTPNPCIACNRYVKWEALLSKSIDIGADYIATGHYARIAELPGGRLAVRNSVTAAKDQTYALYNLTQTQLARTLFPIGDHSKDEIREIASQAGLPVANKPDSQEICFVPDGDYAKYIENQAAQNSSLKLPPAGNFVNADGKVIGKHKGITHYTIGQRRGLEIAAGHRVFVTDIRPETNEVVIGENEELFTTEVVFEDVNYMAVPGLNTGEKLRVKAKIRYNHSGEEGEIEALPGGKAICRFDRPVRAATPGQALVFYIDEYVAGGGTICR